MELNLQVDVAPGVVLTVGQGGGGIVVQASRTLASAEVDRMQIEGLIDSATALLAWYQGAVRSGRVFDSDHLLVVHSLKHALEEMGK